MLIGKKQYADQKVNLRQMKTLLNLINMKLDKILATKTKKKTDAKTIRALPETFAFAGWLCR